jgi:uncharacterized protein (TIGR02599 family)
MQHQLPPLLRVSMVVLDQRAAETLSGNDTLREQVLGQVSSLFVSAAEYDADLEGTPEQPGKLKQLLMSNRLDYRVFTTTIALKQGRWSY